MATEEERMSLIEALNKSNGTAPFSEDDLVRLAEDYNGELSFKNGDRNLVEASFENYPKKFTFRKENEFYYLTKD